MLKARRHDRIVLAAVWTAVGDSVRFLTKQTKMRFGEGEIIIIGVKRLMALCPSFVISTAETSV